MSTITANSVLGTANTNASAAAAPAAPSQDKSITTQDQFLQLLVAQLQNQDPTNPMDNSQITSQMAQISTVNEVSSLNATMSSMSTSLLSSQSLQAANLIGHTVLAPSNALTLSNSQAMGGVNLSGKADDVKVSISDSGGNLVQTIDLGPQAAGVIPFSWDGTNSSGGKAGDGAYTLGVTATQGTAAVQASALAAGQVQSVALGSSGTSLSVSGIGSVSTSQVQQIF